MAVSLNREGWLKLFVAMRRPTGGLSRRFSVKPGGIYKGSKVTIDVQRFGEQVATVITKKTGANLNDITQFSTKEFTPPAYGEAFPMDVDDLMSRMPGVDPYSAAGIEYAQQLTKIFARGFMVIQDKITRAVEVQASQILQTGKLTLTDDSGKTVYKLDFAPKTAHFPTVTTAWSDSGATPMADVISLADTIRSNGKVNPSRLTFGASAWANWIANDTVKEALDNRRIRVGTVDPSMDDSGMVYMGHMWVGTYEYEMWTYNEEYTDPDSGDQVKYIDDDNVVIDSPKTRYDMTSAKVPQPVSPDPRVKHLIPGRLSSRASGFDVTPNVYCTPDGEQIMGKLSSRPLLVPVQIDGFGCLTTTV